MIMHSIRIYRILRGGRGQVVLSPPPPRIDLPPLEIDFLYLQYGVAPLGFVYHP